MNMGSMVMGASVIVVSSMGTRAIGPGGLRLWGLNNLSHLQLWVLGFSLFCLGFDFVDFKG
jgi:hypothetical protein